MREKQRNFCIFYSKFARKTYLKDEEIFYLFFYGIRSVIIVTC